MAKQPKQDTSDYPASPLLLWRGKRRMNQTQAAATLGVHVSQYCQYERGKVLPDPSRLSDFERLTTGEVPVVAMVLHYHHITKEQVLRYFELAPAQQELQL